MPEQVVAHHHAGADGRFGREILGNERKTKADHPQQNQQPAHLPEIGPVAAGDADVDHLGDDQRDKQLESRLQQLKERRQDGDNRVVFEITE